MSLFEQFPGELKLPELTPLPDGRYRMVRYLQFPAPKYTAPAYGSLFERDAQLTGDELVRYSGMRLINVDPSTVPGKQSVPALILTYEQIHATAETQVGQLVTITDENERDVVQAKFIQFSSATRTPGTIGTTTPPGVATAVLDNEQADNEGILRKITRRYVQAGASFANVGEDDIDYELNGLKRRTRNLVAKVGVAFSGTIGVTAHPTDTTLILAGLSIRESQATTKVKATYLQPGILDATKLFDSDGGLLYVTFVSWHARTVPTCLKAGSALTDDPVIAFQGGAAAQLFRDKITNVSGYRTNAITVMMKSDGSALTVGSDQLINSYEKYVSYRRPGVLSFNQDAASPKGWFLEGTPGATRMIKCRIDDYLSTVGTLSGSFAPFSVTQWASGSLYWDYLGESGAISKSADGYLGQQSISGTGPITAAGSIGSDPTPSEFVSLFASGTTCIDSSSAPVFVTDAGVKWYKKTRVIALESP